MAAVLADCKRQAMSATLNRNMIILRRYIRSLGWKMVEADLVKMWGPGERFTRAGTQRGEKKIYLNRELCGWKKFYVLLHEAGHVLSYEINFADKEWAALYYGENGETFRGPQGRAHLNNERQAYYLGGAIASMLKLRMDQKRWREFNWEAHTNRRR